MDVVVDVLVVVVVVLVVMAQCTCLVLCRIEVKRPKIRVQHVEDGRLLHGLSGAWLVGGKRSSPQG